MCCKKLAGSAGPGQWERGQLLLVSGSKLNEKENKNPKQTPKNKTCLNTLISDRKALEFHLELEHASVKRPTKKHFHDRFF